MKENFDDGLPRKRDVILRNIGSLKSSNPIEDSSIPERKPIMHVSTGSITLLCFGPPSKLGSSSLREADVSVQAHTSQKGAILGADMDPELD